MPGDAAGGRHPRSLRKGGRDVRRITGGSPSQHNPSMPMKILASLLVISALVFTGCGRQDTRGSTDTSDAQPSGADPAAVGAADATGTAGGTAAFNAEGGADWNELRGYGYDQRGEFNTSLNALSARVDAEISELRANVSEERRDVLDEVQEAKADFDEKSAALARATQDNWEDARDEAAEAWGRLQEAIAKARSNPQQ